MTARSMIVGCHNYVHVMDAEAFVPITLIYVIALVSCATLVQVINLQHSVAIVPHALYTRQAEVAESPIM